MPINWKKERCWRNIPNNEGGAKRCKNREVLFLIEGNLFSIPRKYCKSCVDELMWRLGNPTPDSVEDLNTGEVRDINKEGGNA